MPRQYGPQFDRLLSGSTPVYTDAPRLFRATWRDRNGLRRFITRCDLPRTNNTFEHALRLLMTFRNATDKFWSKWGPQVYAAAVMVIAKDRRHSLAALDAYAQATSACPSRAPANCPLDRIPPAKAASQLGLI